MDIIKEIMPTIQNLVIEKNVAINVLKEDEKIVVNIIDGIRTRCFKAADSNKLISNLKHYLQA